MSTSPPLTLAHVAVSCHRALLARGLAGTPSRQTHLHRGSVKTIQWPLEKAYQAHTLLQISVSVQLEESDVVVQGLTVVVVVDVGGGHPQGLRPRAAILLGQVVISNPHVDGVSSTHNAGGEWVKKKLIFCRDTWTLQ